MRVTFHERMEEFDALRPEWRALESRALEQNAYLSSRFVWPALAFLPAAAPVWMLSVREGAAGGGTLRALGLFQTSRPRPRFPMVHAAAYGSPHSFLGGLLLDAERPRPALEALLDAVARRTGGLHLHRLNAAGATAELLQSVLAERGASWHEQTRVQRACLALGGGGSSRWREHLSPSRLCNHERQMRKLAVLGYPSWRYLRGDEVTDRTIERFLELEHAGWKGLERTSLRSEPRQEAFFRRMTDAFRADGDVFFTELLLDDEVIASSCNLRSGCDGFAFKVGFDPAYAKYGPGLLNELGFLKALEHPVDQFRFIDSGSDPGSFIEQLWPDRVPLLTGSIALGRLSRTVARAAETLALVRRRIMQEPGQRPVAA